MPTHVNDDIVIIDDAIYKILLDLDDESGEDYRSFINKVISTKVIKKKFILLQGLHRKINRLNKLEGSLDLLAENIKRDIKNYTPEQSIQFYQTLSAVYANDVDQLRKLFLELIKHITEKNAG